MTNDPKNFKIPTAFTLMGHRYSIEMRDDLYEKGDAFGLFLDDDKTIKIQTPTEVTRIDDDDGVKRIKKFIISDATVVETFYHELAHAIFEAIEERELSENEKLVGLIGKALLEVYETSEYEKKEGS